MRIFIAGASLLIFVLAAFLTSFVSAGPHPLDRITVAVNEQARRADISITGADSTDHLETNHKPNHSSSLT